MIRTVHNLACVTIGVLLAIAILSGYEIWAAVCLLILVPVDRLIAWIDEALAAWYEHRREARLTKQEEAMFKGR